MHFTVSMSQRVVQRAVEVGSDTEIVVHIIGTAAPRSALLYMDVGRVLPVDSNT
jgi:hypothetical protein